MLGCLGTHSRPVAGREKSQSDLRRTARTWDHTNPLLTVSVVRLVSFMGRTSVYHGRLGYLDLALRFYWH